MIMTQTEETAAPRQPSEADILDEIRRQVVAELGVRPDEVNADSVLKQLPGADSVRLLRVVARIERRYDVEFDDEDVFTVRTPADLAALILRVASGEA